MTDANRIPDRIGEYLIPHLKEYIFDELSEGYLKKAGLDDILTGVPVPVRIGEVEGLTTLKIAQNMAFVIGCDVNFRHRDSYIAYITRLFTKDFVKPLINDGVDGAAKNDFDYACIMFRAALLIDPGNPDALYCYGRACRDAYEKGEGEDFVGRFKAESLEAFEKLTLAKPDFDMGYYFLGYGYLNLGLYMKAKLTWEDFMKLSGNGEMKSEIARWLEKLSEPVKIEEGYNKVISGRFQEGIDILSPYREDPRFNNWWPLWYYLGLAYDELGDDESAKECLLKVLTLSPSNTEVMEALAAIYEAEGDEEKAEKYRHKVKVVKENREAEKVERNPGLS